MIQRTIIGPSLTLERDIRRDDFGDLYVHDWELQDERGVGCHSRICDELAAWLDDKANDVDEFGGRQFVSGHIDELESDRAVERAEAMGW